MKVKVAEKSNVLGSLFTLGQGGENQESLPSFPAKNAQTLEFRGQVIKEGFGDTSASHSPVGTNVLVDEVDSGEDDADGENPLCYVGRNERLGLNLGRPLLLEGQELNHGKNVDNVNGARDTDGNPKVGVR